jgi:integrase
MSVKQRKGGSWEVRYRDPAGIHKSKSFRRKADAIAFEASVKDSIYRGTFQSPTRNKVTVQEVFDNYLNSKRNLKPKSIEEIKSIWNHIISPTFSKYQVANVKTEHIYKWIDDCVYSDDRVTSAYRMNKALGYFSRMMDFAIELGYIGRNPILKLNGKQIKVTSDESGTKRLAKALTVEELKALAVHCGKFQDMVLFMGTCGLRWAEVVGLRVSDFTNDSRTVVVSHSLSEISGKFYETTTKTEMDRLIFIPKSISEQLKKRVESLNNDDLVFSNERGRPLSNSNFRRRIYLPAIRSAGVPKVTIHDLRHTSASLAINNGADIISVSRMLGHSDTAMTLRKYAHFYTKSLMDLSDDLNKLLDAS